MFDLHQTQVRQWGDNNLWRRVYIATLVIVPTPPRATEDFLANLALFRELPHADIQRLVDKTVAIDAPRGTTLFRRGDPCRGFHIIVYGRVKLSLQSPQGSEKVVELMGPGQSFGEAVMFLEKPYMVTAETIDDSKLLHVDRESVFMELDRDSRFARRMLAGLSRRLHHLISDLESYTLHSGTERVIGYLLRDSADNSTVQTNSMTIHLEAAKGIIASRLHLTQEHFSRILHQLMDIGLIEINGREIRMPDIERLRTHKLG